MVLLFEWIKCDENNIFSDCGINFTDRYKISYDSISHKLTIIKNYSCIPSDFYTLSDSKVVVKQVTCILGKNGCGKTSMLKHLYKSDLMSMTNKTSQDYPYWNTVQVLEYDGVINIYHNQNNLTVVCGEQYNIWDVKERNTVDEILDRGNYAHTTKIFISNDYFVGLNNNYAMKGYQTRIAFTPYDIRILQSEFIGLLTKQSDSMLILKDWVYRFNDYLHKGANQQFFQNILYILLYRNLIVWKKLQQFKYFQNIQILFRRIGRTDAYIEAFGLNQLIIDKFTLKKIINEEVDKTEIENFARDQHIRLDFDILKICAIHGLVLEKCGVKDDTILIDLRVNLVTEILLSLFDLKVNVCEFKSYDDVDALIQILEEQIDKSEYIEEQIDKSKYIDIKRNELTYFKTANKSIEKLKCLIPKIQSESSLPLDEVLVNYLHDEIAHKNSFVIKYIWLRCNCSAGERAFLNIFSYLNSILEFEYLSNHAINGINKNVLLLLDEPDLYCHPEWQREMLHEIIETLELLYQEFNFHIIFSTHSPLFLSDMPRENVVLLDKTEDGICVVDEDINQTFGANIFDLYNNSFFLSSYIGEFALRKIAKTIKSISEWYRQSVAISSNELKNAEYMVGLIGEPVLQIKLKKMLRQIKERELDQ